MNSRWFFSGTVRQATDLYKHVRKLLCAQRDILAPQALAALELSLKETNTLINAKDSTKEAILAQMAELEKAANKWLKPFPHAVWRENVEVLLVAIAVAMAVRTFFLQPFKIPTGSMQPTLFGIIYKDLEATPNFTIPSLPGRVFDACVRGTFYHEMIAPEDGEILDVPRVKSLGITKQPVVVQYRNHSAPTVIPIWFGPDDPSHFMELGLIPGKRFAKGQPIFKFSEVTGDHLFVDRVTYNFRHPERGDIVVFKTHGIEKLMEATSGTADNQFYIKRLVGLPGDHMSIGRDRHTVINGVRLDASTPHFEFVYGFDPKSRPQQSHYSGHEPIDSRLGRPWDLFTPEFEVSPKHYVVFGDNTMNSLDSRYWGDFPQENVIGKSCFVYWPISGRFGWGQR